MPPRRGAAARRRGGGSAARCAPPGGATRALLLLLAPAAVAAVTLKVHYQLANAGGEWWAERIEEWRAAFHPSWVIETVTEPAMNSAGLFEASKNGMLADGDAHWDIFLLDVVWIGTFIDELLDLNPLGFDHDATADFFAGIMQNNHVGEKLLGVPIFLDTGMLYYRPSLLRKYNFFRPPTTWGELQRMARVIQDGERSEGVNDFWGFVFEGKEYEGLTCFGVELIASNGGGNIVADNGVVTLDNPKAVYALEMARSFIGDISPHNTTILKHSDCLFHWFVKGKAAFHRNWPYAMRVSQQEGIDVDITSIPGALPGQSGSVLGGWQWAVSQRTEYPAEAAELLMAMTHKDVQKRMAMERGNMPPRYSLGMDVDLCEGNTTRWMCSFVPQIVARPSTASGKLYLNVSALFRAQVNQAWQGPQDEIPERITQLHEDIDLLLHPPPPPIPYEVPIYVWTCAAAGFIAITVGVPTVWKYTKNKRRMMLLYNNAEIAANCAESIAHMRLEEVAYIEEIPNPNRIQLAFIEILRCLREYRSFLPQSILREDSFVSFEGGDGPAPELPSHPGHEGSPQSSGAGSPTADRLLLIEAPGGLAFCRQLAALLDDEELQQVISTVGAAAQERGDLGTVKLLGKALLSNDPPDAVLNKTIPNLLNKTNSHTIGGGAAAAVNTKDGVQDDGKGKGAFACRQPTGDSTLRSESQRLSGTGLGTFAPGKRKIRKSKFSEGLDAMGSAFSKRIPLWPRDYSPECTTAAVVAGLRLWHDPRGEVLWSVEVIDSLVADSEVVAGCTDSTQPDVHKLAMFLYSVDVLPRDPVWATCSVPCHTGTEAGGWSAEFGWVVEEAESRRALEASHTTPCGDVTVAPGTSSSAAADPARWLAGMTRYVDHLGLQVWGPPAPPAGAAPPAAAGGTPPDARLMGAVELPSGDAVPGPAGGPSFVARYDVRSAPGAVCPLRDQVLWLPEEGDAAAGDGPYAWAPNDTAGSLPPPGVWEYLHARPTAEMLRGEGWQSAPFSDPTLGNLRADCMRQRNMQRHVPALEQRARRALKRNQGSARAAAHNDPRAAAIGWALGAVFDAKVDAMEPTPVWIMRALDLQLLQWHQREYLASLTGEGARVVACITAEDGVQVGVAAGVCSLTRHCLDMDEEKPFHAVNSTLRSHQQSRSAAQLRLSGDAARACGGAPRSPHSPASNTRTPALTNPSSCLGRENAMDVRSFVSSDNLGDRRSGLRTKSRPLHNTFTSNAPATAPEKAQAVTFRSFGGDTIRWQPPGEWRLVTVASQLDHGGDGDTTGAALAADDVECFRLGWMLPQLHHFLYVLTAALTHPSAHVRKSYRGIGGVTFSEKFYAVGSVVRWGAFSSTSFDQGVGVAFAEAGPPPGPPPPPSVQHGSLNFHATQVQSGLGASAACGGSMNQLVISPGRNLLDDRQESTGGAQPGQDTNVFTLWGRSGRDISLWSRLAREQELLYPANTLWEITSSLTREQRQLLGKERLQLFEMREVTEAEALHRAADSLCRELLGGTSKGSGKDRAAVGSQLAKIQEVKELLRGGDPAAALTAALAPSAAPRSQGAGKLQVGITTAPRAAVVSVRLAAAAAGGAAESRGAEANVFGVRGGVPAGAMLRLLKGLQPLVDKAHGTLHAYPDGPILIVLTKSSWVDCAADFAAAVHRIFAGGAEAKPAAPSGFFSEEPATDVFVGVAAGTVQHGNVGDASLRCFSVAQGGPVARAQLYAAYAQRVGLRHPCVEDAAVAAELARRDESAHVLYTFDYVQCKSVDGAPLGPPTRLRGAAPRHPPAAPGSPGAGRRASAVGSPTKGGGVGANPLTPPAAAGDEAKLLGDDAKPVGEGGNGKTRGGGLFQTAAWKSPSDTPQAPPKSPARAAEPLTLDPAAEHAQLVRSLCMLNDQWDRLMQGDLPSMGPSRDPSSWVGDAGGEPKDMDMMKEESWIDKGGLKREVSKWTPGESASPCDAQLFRILEEAISISHSRPYVHMLES